MVTVRNVRAAHLLYWLAKASLFTPIVDIVCGDAGEIIIVPVYPKDIETPSDAPKQLNVNDMDSINPEDII
jgi:hypothetical protein